MSRPVVAVRWTPEDDDALVAMAELSVAEQARRLGRSYSQVHNRRIVLRKQGRLALRQVNRCWTEAELAIIRATLDQPAAVAYALLEDRTFAAVRTKRTELRDRMRDMPNE